MKPTRRDLFTLGGGTVAGLVFTPVPWRLLDDSAKWTQNWSWIPRPPRGEITTRYSACSLCSQGCGLKVRCCGGQPFGVAPVPDHPTSKGTLCPLGFGAHQLPHHPSRIRTALYDGSPVATSDAIAAIAKIVKEADQNGEAIAVVDPRPGRVVSNAYRAFTASLKRGLYVAEAQPVTGLDFERARFVLSVGAPILEGSPRATKAWLNRENTGATFVHAGPSFTKTASLADRWIVLKPGSEAALLHGLEAVLKDTPGVDEAANVTGVPVLAIEALARDLVNRTPSLVIGAKPELQDAIASVHAFLGSRSALTAPRPAPFEEPAAATPLATIPNGSLRLAFVESSQIEAVSSKVARTGAIVALSAYVTRARYTIPVPAFLESLEEIGTPSDAVAATWGIASPISPAPGGVLLPERVIAQVTGASESSRDEALRQRATRLHASGRGSCFSFAVGTTTPVKDIPSSNDFWKELQEGALWVDDPSTYPPAAFVAGAFKSAGPDVAPPLATKLYRESKLGRA